MTPREGSHTLGWQGLRCLPTPAGWATLALVGVLVLLARWTGLDALRLLAVWLAAILLGSVWLACRTLLGLRLEWAAAHPVFAGQPAELPVVLANPAMRARTGLARLQGGELGDLLGQQIVAHRRMRALVLMAAHRQQDHGVGLEQLARLAARDGAHMDERIGLGSHGLVLSWKRLGSSALAGARVEDVAQRVAEQVHGEDGQGQHGAGPEQQQRRLLHG